MFVFMLVALSLSCSINNCETCSIFPGFCSNCLPGYKRSIDPACSPSLELSYIENCEIISDLLCLKCVPGFSLFSGRCEPECPENCICFDPNVCIDSEYADGRKPGRYTPGGAGADYYDSTSRYSSSSGSSSSSIVGGIIAGVIGGLVLFVIIIFMICKCIANINRENQNNNSQVVENHHRNRNNRSQVVENRPRDIHNISQSTIDNIDHIDHMDHVDDVAHVAQNNRIVIDADNYGDIVLSMELDSDDDSNLYLDTDNCEYCNEALGQEYLRMLPCKHLFHEDCLWQKMMVEGIKVCPICQVHYY